MKHFILLTYFIKLVNLFFVKQKKVIFLPHSNGKADHYDIINYRSDNVLCLLNYVLRHNKYIDYELVCFIFDETKINNYNNYIDELGTSCRLKFIKYSQFRVVRELLTSRLCFTDQGYYDFTFKLKSQKIISLGYFTPFKRDYLWDGKEIKQHKDFATSFKRHNRSFDYYITTSDLASRVLSIDTGIVYEKFIPMGMSRNQFLCYSNKEMYNTLSNYYEGEITKVITYTPTYRLYKEEEGLNCMGYACDLEKIYGLLEKYNAILVIKGHPKKPLGVKDNNNRIISFDSFKGKFSLYDLLSITDVLITDYTSTYFDFLHRDKPVIFNNYDYDVYHSIQGFTFEPMSPYCAGYDVRNYLDLCNALEKCMLYDEYKEHRHFVHSIINTADVNKTNENITNKFK